MEAKKVAGLGLLAAVIAGVFYIVTRPPEPEGEPDIDMTLDWEEN